MYVPKIILEELKLVALGVWDGEVWKAGEKDTFSFIYFVVFFNTHTHAHILL